MRQSLYFCMNLLLLSVNYVSACQDGKLFVLFAVNSLALTYVNVTTISIYLKAGLKTNRSLFLLQTDNKKDRINLTNDVTKTNSSIVIQFGNQKQLLLLSNHNNGTKWGCKIHHSALRSLYFKKPVESKEVLS